MSICTFFGHRDAPFDVETEVYDIVKSLVVNKGVDKFYIGNQGNFDKVALSTVKKIQKKFTYIKYAVVYAYLPKEHRSTIENTVFPEGLETVPKKFAISYRNKWLVDNSDYIVTYVTRSFGGAAKYKEYAEKRGKCVINIKR